MLILFLPFPCADFINFSLGFPLFLALMRTILFPVTSFTTLETSGALLFALPTGILLEFFLCRFPITLEIFPLSLVRFRHGIGTMKTTVNVTALPPA